MFRHGPSVRTRPCQASAAQRPSGRGSPPTTASRSSAPLIIRCPFATSLSRESPLLIPTDGGGPHAARSQAPSPKQLDRVQKLETELAGLEKGGTPGPSSIYCSLIDAYSRLRMMDKVERLFARMRSRGTISLAEPVFRSAIIAYAKLGKMEEAEKLQREAQALGFASDLWTYNALIHGWFEKDDHQSAEAVLREMEAAKVQKNEVTWSTLISGYAKLGSLDKAQRLIQEMVGAGLKVDAHSAAPLIYALARRGEAEKAQALLETLLTHGLPVDSRYFTALISAYSKAGKPQQLASVLDMMERHRVTPELATYNAMLGLYAHHNLLDRAEKLLATLESKGPSPDLFSYAPVIHAYCARHEPNLASLVWERMERRGIRPDMVLVHSMLRALLFDNDLVRARALLVRAEKQGLPLDRNCFITLTNKYSSLGMHEEARSLILEMQSRGISERPRSGGDVAQKTAHVRNLCEEGKLSQAQMIVDIMETDGPAPNDITYAALLHGYARAGLVEEGMATLEKMEQKGWADARSYRALAKGFGFQKREAGLQRLRAHIAAKGRTPPAAVLGELVRLQGQKKQIESVKALVRELEKLPASELDAATYVNIVLAHTWCGCIEEVRQWQERMKAAGHPLHDRFARTLRVKAETSAAAAPAKS